MEFNLSQLADALPYELNFYHLGKVEQYFFPFAFQEVNGVVFRIYGDLNAIMVILFDSNLDCSTYTELGNLLAGRWVTQIQKERKLDLMISPPQMIQPNFLEKLKNRFMLSEQPIIQKTYAHMFKNFIIPIETLIFLSPAEGMGYA